MPLVFGGAVPHDPSMFVSPSEWTKVHTAISAGLPQPPQFESESTDEIRDRLEKNFLQVRERLAESRPDVVVLVGDDQNEVFSDALMPTLALFLGETVSGTTNVALAGQSLRENHVELKGMPKVAETIFSGLVERHFDVTRISELSPLSRPDGGIGHAFTRPASALGLAHSTVAVIPLFLNVYFPPLPSAARCHSLGVAIREIVDQRPERVAIVASGGLSHDIKGPRAGWIDEPLDRWLLSRIESGDSDALKQVFQVDSASLRGGTGELRNWIVVAAAFQGWRPRVVDYVPVYHMGTGLAWALWEEA